MNIKISGSLIKDLFKIVLEKEKVSYGRKACPPPPPKKKR
ncbi:MAG: hypothetical protein SLAVMIC_00126 [uncultured marine phage]|uniref:Uncharacterized protein n=1 Tax=uncultured marine phage TaxID=707152 RepID=A0A8D9CEN1_9VIRU|nr:MAG: hypothetical protein SLAVMIC_00126 [uncultured marine phage]